VLILVARTTRELIVKSMKFKILTSMIWLGYFLMSIGLLGILLGITGIFNMSIFSYGLSSGIRIIGSVAIAGCLLSAIGHGATDHETNNI